MDLALVTFAVEKRISSLAKEHGQSVLCHGQSCARNSRFQRTLGGSARTGHGLHWSIFGMVRHEVVDVAVLRPRRGRQHLLFCQQYCREILYLCDDDRRKFRAAVAEWVDFSCEFLV